MTRRVALLALALLAATSSCSSTASTKGTKGAATPTTTSAGATTTSAAGASTTVAVDVGATTAVGGAPPPTTPAPTTPAPTTVPCRPMTDPAANVRQGDCGAAVTQIQERLVVWGYPVTVDGKFGPGTKAAIVKFQTDLALTADGVVGSETWSILSSPPGEGDY